ncbi:MAG TPA: hypothetical protein P5110_02560 [Candidatus Omnitrophota bacterium]|nr:hypothetical protein [Candidatus Omnitrophota bacterium]HRZ14369.1 hypothetical protein [Candidatus Omnitrophota bacterium]
MKKLLFLLIVAGLLYLAWTRIVQPMLGAGKGVSNMYFGNASVPANTGLPSQR